MAITTFDGPVVSAHGFALPSQGGTAESYSQLLKTVTGIADSAATTVFTITVPNANNSAVIRVLVRSMITAASHTPDSTRVVEYNIVVTRVAGAVAVAAISAAIGAQIATVGSGQTLTTALTIAAVSGGATASNSFAVQVTNVVSVAGTSETQVFCELLNYAGSVGTYVGAPTTNGVTIA